MQRSGIRGMPVAIPDSGQTAFIRAAGCLVHDFIKHHY
jgi:hypothetical protein